MNSFYGPLLLAPVKYIYSGGGGVRIFEGRGGRLINERCLGSD